MKKLLIASALILSAFAASAQSAKPDMYAEVGYTHVNVESDSVEVSPTAVRVVLGNNFNSNIAIEGHALVGANSSSIGVAEYNIEPSYGVFLKLQVPVGDLVKLYARAGWAKSKLSGSAYGVTVSASESGAAGGVGVSVALTKEAELFVDVMKYDTGSGTTTTAATTGFRLNF